MFLIDDSRKARGEHFSALYSCIICASLLRNSVVPCPVWLGSTRASFPFTIVCCKLTHMNNSKISIYLNTASWYCRGLEKVDKAYSTSVDGLFLKASFP